MYCSHCGSKNEENSKFCSSCGKELIKVKEQNKQDRSTGPIHNSIIRKSIKKDAQEKNKGPLYLGNIIMFTTVVITLIIMAINFGEKTIDSSGGINYSLGLTNGNFVATSIIYIILMAVIFYFTLGMNKVSLDISRDKKTSIGNIFKYPFQNINVYLKVLAINILVYLLLELLTYIPIVGIILYLVLAIYLSPILVIVSYIMIDNNKLSITEAIKKAIKITKGKKATYYALILSFAGWYLLSIFTLGLLIVWIIPYMDVAISNFYLYITGEKEYNNATKGMSDGLIIGVAISVYVIFIVIVVIAIFTFALIYGIKEGINNSNEIIIEDDSTYVDNYISGDSKNISGLDIFIPDDYKEIPLESYEKAYSSKEGNIVIGLITYDMSENVSAREYTELYKSSLSSAYSCNNIQTSPINYYNWETLECGGGRANIKNYIAIQNNKLYLLTVSYQDKSLVAATEIMNRIEDDLRFSNTVA
ncbi:MAG: DUF975 family protein [bacterium]|nr:DUF975 family protein [bacterium]